MALSFPTDPTSGDTYVAPNGYTYTWDGTVYSDQPVIPFQIPFTDMVTIIFTDGAWQSSTFSSLTNGGAWD